MKQVNNEISFPMLAICFQGRTGKQIHDHFLDLLKKDPRLADPRKIKLTLNFDLYMHRYQTNWLKCPKMECRLQKKSFEIKQKYIIIYHGCLQK